jgi:hypothetical protein
LWILQLKAAGMSVAVSLCQGKFRSDPMADVTFILITIVFFIVAGLYVRGCDRL